MSYTEENGSAKICKIIWIFHYIETSPTNIFSLFQRGLGLRSATSGYCSDTHRLKEFCLSYIKVSPWENPLFSNRTPDL